MARRLDELQSRINKVSPKVAEASNGESRERSNRGLGRALHIGTEFIAGVLVGGLIGYLFDEWLETRPFGFIVFFLLGIAAGLLNVVRSAQRLQDEMPDIEASTVPVAKDEEDD